MRSLILLIENESAFRDHLRLNLDREGFEVAVAQDGMEALLSLAESNPVAVVFDGTVAGTTDINIWERIQRSLSARAIPLIVMTIRDTDTEQFSGMLCGTHDYITKPFDIEDLLARLHALVPHISPAIPDVVICADIEMDLRSFRVKRAGRPVHLGPTEFRLLHHFLLHPETVFSREIILATLWDHEIHVERRTIDVHIRRLRKALNGPGDYDPIRTVRSYGYSFERGPVRNISRRRRVAHKPASCNSIGGEE